LLDSIANIPDKAFLVTRSRIHLVAALKRCLVSLPDQRVTPCSCRDIVTTVQRMPAQCTAPHGTLYTRV
jgi:hypothetical protein